MDESSQPVEKSSASTEPATITPLPASAVVVQVDAAELPVLAAKKAIGYGPALKATLIGALLSLPVIALLVLVGFINRHHAVGTTAYVSLIIPAAIAGYFCQRATKTNIVPLVIGFIMAFFTTIMATSIIYQLVLRHLDSTPLKAGLAAVTAVVYVLLFSGLVSGFSQSARSTKGQISLAVWFVVLLVGSVPAIMFL